VVRWQTHRCIAYMENTDEQLLQAAILGDQDAFGVLMRRYLAPMYSFVRRLGVGPGDAEDVTQEIFFKLWKHRRSFRADARCKPWLYQIGRNTAIDWLRKKRAIPFSEFDVRLDEDVGESIADTIADEAPLPDELVSRAQDADFLDHMLDQLPTAIRQIVLLHAIEGLTFQEVAGIVGRPLNTVKSQYRRAIQVLQASVRAPKP
jgi:RNA polymerase sigma-70 factor (ECF subfamily)